MPKTAAAEKIQEPEILVDVKGDLITVEPDKAKLLFQNPALVDVFVAQVDARIADFPAMNVDTKKSRDIIRSTAVAIRDMKTGIDKVGAELADDMRKQVKAIDADRSRIWDLLEERQKAVRQPLTDWEDADKARKEKHQAAIALARKLGQVGFGETVEQIQARIDQLPTNDFPSYDEFADEAELVVTTAFERLVAAKTTRQNEDRARAEQEAERARLEKERAEFEAMRLAERQRQEAEARAHQLEEAERRRAEEAEAAERRRAAEAEEAERRRKIDEETARLAKERAEFEAERQRMADEKAKAEAAAAAVRAQAERAAQEEADRVATEERARQDAIDREQATGKVRAEITAAVLDVVKGLTQKHDTISAAIAEAILAGRIPHIRVEI